jgi:hypothetical protein
MGDPLSVQANLWLAALQIPGAASRGSRLRVPDRIHEDSQGDGAGTAVRMRTVSGAGMSATKAVGAVYQHSWEPIEGLGARRAS